MLVKIFTVAATCVLFVSPVRAEANEAKQKSESLELKGINKIEWLLSKKNTESKRKTYRHRIYVSQHSKASSDKQDGSKKRPFSSLDKALELAMKTEGGKIITIFIKDGSYSPEKKKDHFEIHGSQNIALVAIGTAVLEKSLRWVPSQSSHTPHRPNLVLTTQQGSLEINGDVACINKEETPVFIAVNAHIKGSLRIDQKARLALADAHIEGGISAEHTHLVYAKGAHVHNSVHVAHAGKVKECQFDNGILDHS